MFEFVWHFFCWVGVIWYFGGYAFDKWVFLVIWVLGFWSRWVFLLFSVWILLVMFWLVGFGYLGLFLGCYDFGVGGV